MAVSDKHPILAGVFGWLKQAAGPARRDLLIVLFTIMFVATFFAPRVAITVATGDAGVLWYRFGGGVAPQPLNDGLHLIFPWDRIYSYYIRERNDTHSYKAITKDGITVDCQITLLYHLVRENLPQLHQQIGQDYVDVLMLPAIGAEVRRAIANYSVDSLYGAERHQIEAEILTDIVSAPENRVAGRGRQIPIDLVFADEIHIREVQLPEELSQAILEKARQQQLALGYTYRLDRERLEAQRKEIEAGGISKFQQVVQQGISPTYLQWRGIEATLQLATSPNAKVIVIGGKDGLPLILNTDGATAPAAAPGAPWGPHAQAGAPEGLPQYGGSLSSGPPLARGSRSGDRPVAADAANPDLATGQAKPLPDTAEVPVAPAEPQGLSNIDRSMAGNKEPQGESETQAGSDTQAAVMATKTSDRQSRAAAGTGGSTVTIRLPFKIPFLADAATTGSTPK